MQPNKILLPRDGHAWTWTVRPRRKLWKVLCQPQQQRGSETKKNVCACVRACVRFWYASLKMQTAGDMKCSPCLRSHWLRCCQAHLASKQATRQPIRAGRGVPLSAVTSPGTLDGEPQSLNALMRENAQGKQTRKLTKGFTPAQLWESLWQWHLVAHYNHTALCGSVSWDSLYVFVDVLHIEFIAIANLQLLSLVWLFYQPHCVHYM